MNLPEVRALLIDLDVDLLRWMQSFADRNNLQLEHASEANTALTMLSQFKPQLVLIDYLFLVSHGKELLDKLSDDPKTSVIIMLEPGLTARFNDAPRFTGCDFLFKPIHEDELKLRVEKALTDDNLKTDHLEYGAIKIDLRVKRATVAGKHLDLSPKEYQILKLLVEEQGRVIGCKEIIAKVWRVSQRVSDNDVRQYIYLLRKKFKKCVGPTDCIHNSKGFGYRLICLECYENCKKVVCFKATSSKKNNIKNSEDKDNDDNSLTYEI